VSLTVRRGEALGIVGESGSGKSTLIRLFCGLLRRDSGSIVVDGKDVGEWMHAEPRELRRFGQLVFQSPSNSFDPRMRVGRAISEPVRALERRTPSRAELVELTSKVGLPSEMLDRYPHQLSGGQLQRMSLARALSVKPRVLYADEPTSALDVSVQAEVLDLLRNLRAELGLTLILVTHDLAVVGQICDNVLVLQHGRMVESGTARQVLTDPGEPYTADLVGAARAVSLRRTPANSTPHMED
jgi:ABC-type glutathione transport system ATPase component